MVLTAVTGWVAHEFWPTLYSAEEIRAEWVQGFWLDTRVETPEGVTLSRTEVQGWSAEGAVLVDRPLAPDNQATDHGQSVSVTWKELQLHAPFAEATTDRRCQKRQTPFGVLEGWLFVTATAEDTSELFFADDLPGPPVVFSRSENGKQILPAVQVGRHGHSEAL